MFELIAICAVNVLASSSSLAADDVLVHQLHELRIHLQSYCLGFASVQSVDDIFTELNAAPIMSSMKCVQCLEVVCDWH